MNAATCAIDLVCVALRPSGLAVLLVGERAGLRLPTVRWAGGRSLGAAAAALEREALRRRSSWNAQVSARAVRGHPLRAQLAITYLVAATERAEEREHAEWCALTKLPKRMPVCHRESIADALVFASSRADRWALSLALLPAEFTLTQLQHAHEALLGRRLYKASFRRVVKAVARATPTGTWRAEGRGRPAQLYRRAGAVTQ